MTAAELLADLRNRGFQIDAAGGKLLVHPGSRLTSTDRAAIQRCVVALLAELEDEHEWFVERAGILEYDAGMTRAEAEVLAVNLLRSLQARSRGAPA